MDSNRASDRDKTFSKTSLKSVSPDVSNEADLDPEDSSLDASSKKVFEWMLLAFPKEIARPHARPTPQCRSRRLSCQHPRSRGRHSSSVVQWGYVYQGSRLGVDETQ